MINVEVLKSRPRGYFDHSAVSAVKLWKFKPKVVDGEPVETSGVQRIEYKLAPH
ncbi:MAG: TonB family protein [Nevskiaceae bacterium]